MIEELKRVRGACTAGWITFLAVHLLTAGHGAPVRGEEPTDGGSWAVIAADGVLPKSLADLTQAELSVAGIKLVERERIAAVLDEQHLAASALMEGKQSVRLGRLLAADAIVYIERVSDASEMPVRVRVVETRTGIRLWDRILDGPAGSLVKSLGQDLPLLRRKVALDEQDRRYVGVLGLIDEQGDVNAQGFARSLQAVLEEDLQRQPNAVVLERAEMHLILNEKDLTGVELQLRNSSLLLAGGIRHQAATKTFEIDVRLSRPDGQILKSLALNAADPMDTLLRKQLVAAILSNEVAGGDEVALAGEGTQFETRADWLSQHERYEEALDAAYAAAALAPSRQNHERLSALHAKFCPFEGRRGSQRSEQLRQHDYHQLSNDLSHALAAHHHDLTRIQMAIADNVKVIDDKGFRTDDPFWPHVPIWPDEPEAVARQRERLDALRDQKFELLRSCCAPDPVQLGKVLIARLALASYFAHDPDEALDEIMNLQAEIDRNMANVSGLGWRVYYRRKNAEALARALRGVTGLSIIKSVGWNTPRPPEELDCRDWDMNGIRERCRSLATHPEPWIRLVYLSRVALLDGEDAIGAAEEAFQQLNNLQGQHYGPLASIVDGPIVWKLHECGRLEPLVEAMIASAEKTGDTSRLPSWPSGLNNLLRNSERDVRDALLDRASKIRPVSPWPDSGPWSHFDMVRSVVWLVKRPHGKISGQYYDLTNIYSVVDDGEGKFAFRARPQSSPPLEPTRYPLTTRWRNMLHIEPTPNGTFCTTQGEFYLDNGTELTQITTPRVSDASRTRYLDGKLYFVGKEGLGVWDPAAQAARNIASSLRVVPRHQLDGGSRYTIRHVLADPERKCLWFDIGGPGRDGIWNYSTADGKFQRVIEGPAQLLEMRHQELLYAQSHTAAYWHVFRIATGETEHLQGYRPLTPRVRGIASAATLQVGAYIINPNGVLYTRDGLQHEPPEAATTGIIKALPDLPLWLFVDPIENGFRGVNRASDGGYALWDFTLRSRNPTGDVVRLDLLKSVDVSRDVLSGDWSVAERRLSGTALQGFAKLHLPAELPAAFQLRLVATPRKGTNLSVMMATSGAFFYVGIDHTRDGKSFRSGIGAVDTKGIIDNETGLQERVLVPDQENTIVITVRPQHVDVQANGSQIVAFDGDFSRLAPEHWMRSEDWPLALACEESDYEFSEITLTPLDAPTLPTPSSLLNAEEGDN
ncbi:MAG: hypothetical protein ABI614_08205 [Planctomycetota bacterium]